ncbi:MAG: DUF550 domain-containing protein [Hyphomicrobiaceae bacterium]|nr:MAG: DUF550 domain-containing protein [Hyphomicrobiaceae bacterium]
MSVAIDFLNFTEACRQWSESTFGPREMRGPVGPLKHLEKEAREAYTEPDPEKQREEIADTMFLVLDAAWRAGMTLADLTAECNKKLVKNKSRTWGAPTGDEPVEHVRG